MTRATIASLHVYPVKSCRGIACTSVGLVATGLAGDRQWLVVSQTGRFLTQRELPRLALVETSLSERELQLTAPGMPRLNVATRSSGPALTVTIWGEQCAARDAGVEPAQWLSRFLGRPVRLVEFDFGRSRLSSAQWTQAIAAPVTFTDAFPILVISQASLDDLNGRLEGPLPMNRFRPNVVLEGLQAYDEDRIHELVAGDVRLRLVKPCTRCKITTTDQASGAVMGAEPLATLKKYRWSKQLQGVLFGQNAIVVGGVGAELRVGQQFAVTWRQPI